MEALGHHPTLFKLTQHTDTNLQGGTNHAAL